MFKSALRLSQRWYFIDGQNVFLRHGFPIPAKSTEVDQVLTEGSDKFVNLLQEKMCIGGNHSKTPMKQVLLFYVFMFFVSGLRAGDLTTPEITVLENTTNVADGSTYYFPVTFVGTPVTRTFTIRNEGTGPLDIGALAAVPAGFTLVGTFPTGAVAAGGQVTFQIQIDAASTGTPLGTISFGTNDADENPFNFIIRGTVITPSVPEIAVEESGVNVPDGGAFDFGTTPVGTSVTKTFVIRNLGNTTLTLGALSPVPTGFAVVGSFPSTGSIAPGSQLTFQIRLQAITAGSRTGTISFINNDSDENPFNFTISGVVAPANAPEIAVLEGTAGIADGGLFDYGSTPEGTPLTRTFTIRNTGNVALSLGAIDALGSGFSLVGAFPSAPVDAGAETTFQVRLDATAAGDYTSTVSFVNGDADENPFNFTIKGSVTVPPAPEISFEVDGLAVSSGGTVNFGSTTQGTSVTKTFTIKNPGTADLVIGTFPALPSGFSLASALSSTTINAGSSATFQLKLDALTVGNPSGTISFSTNDSDENPFSFTVSGVVTALPSPEIVVEQGATGIALAGTYAFGDASQGSGITRTFTVKNSGTAPLVLGTVSLPAGFTLAAAFGTSTVSAGTQTTFQIRLDAVTPGSFSGVVSFSTNDTDENPFTFTVTGTVLPPPSPEISVESGGTAIADGGTFSFGSTITGTPVTKTFTIKNTGTASLTIGALDPLPVGFSLTGTFPAQSIAAGGEASFSVTMSADAPGTPSGVLSFTNGDSDENPYNFTISGAVATAAPVVAVFHGGEPIAAGATVDFGKTEFEKPLEKTFKLRNTGNLALILRAQPVATPGFSTSVLPSLELAPAAEAAFTIAFNASTAGVASGTWTIESNAPGGSFVINLVAEAVILPGVKLLQNRPNPAKGNTQLPVMVTGAPAEVSITIFNAEGNQVLALEKVLLQEQAEPHLLPLSVDNLPPGIYIVSLRNGSRSENMRMLVKR